MRKRVLILMILCAFFIVGCEKEKENVVQTIASTEETETVVETETKAETESAESNVTDNKDYESFISSIKEQSDVIKSSLENEELTQNEMNMKAQELYVLWDNALNELWEDVQNVLPEEEYNQILDEQLSWIEEKEKAVEEAGKEVEGGSLYPLVVNSEAAKITEERVYELYEILK